MSSATPKPATTVQTTCCDEHPDFDERPFNVLRETTHEHGYYGRQESRERAQVPPMSTDAIKPFEVTLTVRNNRLKQRRLELNLSARQLAENVGIGYHLYCAYESMRTSPIAVRSGDWKPTACRIAQFFGLPPEELWPPEVLQVLNPRSTALLSAKQITAFGASQHAQRRLQAPDDLLVARQDQQQLHRALDALPERHRLCLIWRYGLDGSEARTITDVCLKDAQHFRRAQPVTTERMRQILAEAMRRIQIALPRGYRD